MIKVVIAEDQPLIREGLKYIIEQDKEIQVAGCAENGLEAYEICGKERPDIVLMDLLMPVCDGVKGMCMIKNSMPDVKVMILTTFKESGDIIRAMEAGADCYILKDIDPDQLIVSIKAVSKGLKIMHEEVHKSYMVGRDNDHNNIYCREDFHLSERDVDIIRQIVHGNSNKGIAVNLKISEGIVRNTISGILGKLKLQDRTQLAVFSIKNKIV
ncbi:MAG TPA: response regulator transcription factor [Clostridia bacterium]|nr:response regulator transcription factor [Clostridia bacterium]